MRGGPNDLLRLAMERATTFWYEQGSISRSPEVSKGLGRPTSGYTLLDRRFSEGQDSWIRSTDGFVLINALR
jgi:hypothetical protein